MSIQGWVENVGWAGTDGASLTNSTAQTSLLPGSAKFTLPANFFDKVGKSLRITATGRISTVTATPGTLLFELKLGAVVAASGGALSLNVSAQTNDTFVLEWLLTARAIGSGTSANLIHVGKITSRALLAGVANTAVSECMPDTAPAVGTGFDSTSSQVVDLMGTWSVASASNSITLHQFILEVLN